MSGGGSSELRGLRARVAWLESADDDWRSAWEELSKRVSALEVKCAKKEPAKAKKKGGK